MTIILLAINSSYKRNWIRCQRCVSSCNILNIIIASFNQLIISRPVRWPG